MMNGGNSTSSNNLYNAAVDDETYNDACDLGQCCMNPSWFLSTKLQSLFQKRTSSLQQDEGELPTASSRKMPSTGCQYATYLVAIFGSWAIVFTRFYPLAGTNESFPRLHLTFGYVLFILCVTSWRFAGGTLPGSITSESLHKFGNYPYDELLYEDGKLCPTLHLRRYSCTQVPRFDHYCGWVNQTVGEENYRFFVVFLAVHTFMCVYGTAVILQLLWNEGDLRSSVQGTTSHSWIEQVIALALVDYWLTAVLVVLGSASCALVPFLSFHMYIIATGMTTNEFFKWRIVKDRHKKATEQYQRKLLDDTTANGLESRAPFTDPGPCPTNIYNLGYAANVWEVLSPRSLRRMEHRKNV
jgi:palmitoyltransferase ZDHHC4